MITSSNRKVSIHITIFKKGAFERSTSKDMDHRFVCSICLNKTGYNCEKKSSKPCPVCQKHYLCDHKNDKTESSGLKQKDRLKRTIEEKAFETNKDTKNVQTSQTDLTQDLSLLKEVLTVFQSKKQIDIKTNSKIVMKDVSVETESRSKLELQAKLTKSRIFQFSIDEASKNNGNNFKIVNYSQPYSVKASQYSIDLIKHKSSSIPQMKMEELRYSLKEKTRSKDAIEEVNRMFATVKKRDLPNLEEQNRPMIRNGPRVLPVVKTKTYHESNKKESNCEGNEMKELPDLNIKSYQNGTEDDEHAICKCCQTNNNIQLSGGDSVFKHECCYHKMLCEGKCEKCVYMLCCHYQKNHKVETGCLMCESCKNNANEKLNERCDGSNHCDHF